MNNNIITTENYIIKKDEYYPNIYRIHFFYHNQTIISIINSFVKTKIIKGATITDNYKTIQFNAVTVETYNSFKERIKNSQKNITPDPNPQIINCVNAVISLTTQINYLLEKENKIFIGYNPDHLLVINEKSYIYLGYDHLLNIIPQAPNQPQTLLITTPFTSEDFFSLQKYYK
jgi:hypothetical protein